ncbi:MAG: hypothetical protein Q7U30_11950, partial [Methylicorpusculum sp.]|nr:hypothetical protein [Methylicorpusculum sp.]
TSSRRFPFNGRKKFSRSASKNTGYPKVCYSNTHQYKSPKSSLLSYIQRRSKFGTGLPVKGRRKTIPIGSMPASMLTKPLPNTPLPP